MSEISVISEKELVPAIRELVPKVDLQTIGVKQFIQLLSKELGVNVKPQKAFIKKTLIEIIEEMNQNDEESHDSNASEDGEPNEQEDEDDEDDADVPPRKKKGSNGSGRGGGGGGGLAVKKEISDKLAGFLKCGKEMSRTDIVKKLWEYIREHDLQNPSNKREIMLDDAMQEVFGCHSFTMFTMNKYIGAHIHPFKPVDLTTVPPTKKSSKRKSSEKSSEKKKKKRTAGTQPPYQLSEELEQVVGKPVLPRPQVVSAIWDYIKANNLQNPQDKREILCDDKLKAVMKRDKVSMFKMNQLITPHLLQKVERTSLQQDMDENQDEGSSEVEDDAE